MYSLRPLVFLLSVIGLPSAVVAGPAANASTVATADSEAAPDAVPGIKELKEPSAKIVATGRKKAVASTPRRAAPELETFPGDAPDNPQPIPGVERLVFDRAPLRVALAAGRERRVYLPWEAALHLPAEAAGLQAQIIGTTLYLTGQSGQPIVRIIAEGLDGQGMIPLDIQVRDQLAGVPDELEISMSGGRSGQKKSIRRSSADEEDDDDEPAAPDLVQLTRFCAQNLYAPQRLIKPLPGVRAVEVRSMPVGGLYRGASVLTTPIGAWRSAALHVTAVRFTNRGQTPIELDMDLLRGRWVAATPQHHVLARNGDDADTTAVCLISEQPFDASRP